MSSTDCYNASWTSIEDIERTLMQASNIDTNSPLGKCSLKSNKPAQQKMSQFTEEATGENAPFAEELLLQQPKIYGRGQMLKELEKNSMWGYKDRVIEQSMREVPGLKVGLSDQVFQETLTNPLQFEDAKEVQNLVDTVDEIEPHFDQSNINWSNLAKLTVEGGNSSGLIDNKESHKATNEFINIGVPSQMAHMYDQGEDESHYVKVELPLTNSALPVNEPPNDEESCSVQDLPSDRNQFLSTKEDIVNFFELVKRTLLNQPEVCKEFLNILNDLIVNKMNKSLTVKKMLNLFRDQPLLAKQFNDLLPPVFKDPLITEHISSQPNSEVKPQRCRNFLVTKLLEEKAGIQGDEQWSHYRDIFVNWIELLGTLTVCSEEVCATEVTNFSNVLSTQKSNSETVNMENRRETSKMEAGPLLLTPEDVISGSKTGAEFSIVEDEEIDECFPVMGFTMEDVGGLESSQDPSDNSNVEYIECEVHSVTPENFIDFILKNEQKNVGMSIVDSQESSQDSAENTNVEHIETEPPALTPGNFIELMLQNDKTTVGILDLDDSCETLETPSSSKVKMPDNDESCNQANVDNSVSCELSTDPVLTLTSHPSEIHQFFEPPSREEGTTKSHYAARVNDTLNSKNDDKEGDLSSFYEVRSTRGYDSESSDSRVDLENIDTDNSNKIESVNNFAEDDLTDSFSKLGLSMSALSPANNSDNSSTNSTLLLRPDQMITTTLGVNPEEVKIALEKLEQLDFN